MNKPELNPQERVFFALWPGDNERAGLAAWQAPLRELCGGKAMLPATLHATLVFLGNVPVHRLEALKLVAQEVRGVAFNMSIGLARYWGHNHILYAAPPVLPAPLSLLVYELEQHLRVHRFRFEQRPYN